MGWLIWPSISVRNMISIVCTSSIVDTVRAAHLGALTMRQKTSHTPMLRSHHRKELMNVLDRLCHEFRDVEASVRKTVHPFSCLLHQHIENATVDDVKFLCKLFPEDLKDSCFDFRNRFISQWRTGGKQRGWLKACVRGSLWKMAHISKPM